ncbi:MAG TPA: glycosyltransferase family 4 protein [Candidatus Dormibacteraeota bacterium]|nr:glycosyltransferase family 4 protein [Candidatus Dormibacteraeota bacterium]
MGPLRIAMVVSPWYPVPPAGYGGIEVVAFNLAGELQRRGHHVTVIGREGSTGPFEVAALAPAEWTGQLGTKDHINRETQFLHRAYEFIRGRAFDVVHDHTGFVGILLGALLGHPPAVATLHGDLPGSAYDFLAEVDEEVRLVGISRSQLAQCPTVEWGGMVYNGVDTSHYRPVAQPREKDDYLFQLARISPKKGQHISIELARRLGVRLVLAGKVDTATVEYFERQVKPHIGQVVEWHENVSGDVKARLLARARAMINPIQWEEPFGLAMVEAMVSGTPVLATNRGSAVELVEPGVTGWLADDVDGLVQAYGRLGEIDPHRCAARAAQRFGLEQMANGYLSVYETARLGQQFRKPA